MNLYEKIGRLIKHNKIFDLSNNSNISSKSIEESSLGLELDSIESILSDILSPSKLDTSNSIKNLNINNKEFTKSDLEEAQNLIKKCSQDEQSILISILEIQLSLVGNENKYIKYEKINDKNVEKIEKNIYWVITCEIHKRVHQEKTEFEEYCHCVKDQKEKYILGSEYNFKYENIDSTICNLKNMNKNIEFIAIKSIFISFYNMTCEFIQKYLEIIEYNKKNQTNEYFIFEYIINDYIQEPSLYNYSIAFSGDEAKKNIDWEVEIQKNDEKYQIVQIDVNANSSAGSEMLAYNSFTFKYGKEKQDRTFEFWLIFGCMNGIVVLTFIAMTIYFACKGELGRPSVQAKKMQAGLVSGDSIADSSNPEYSGFTS